MSEVTPVIKFIAGARVHKGSMDSFYSASDRWVLCGHKSLGHKTRHGFFIQLWITEDRDEFLIHVHIDKHGFEYFTRSLCRDFDMKPTRGESSATRVWQKADPDGLEEARRVFNKILNRVEGT